MFPLIANNVFVKCAISQHPEVAAGLLKSCLWPGLARKQAVFYAGVDVRGAARAHLHQHKSERATGATFK